MPGPEDASESKDQKPAAPQRLQSLSSRGGARGGLRGGRFVPNAVGRRSKEERESTAPALKPQDSEADPDSRRGQPKGKMERRKARQMGTRAEAAGPLAAPTIAATTGGRMPTMPSGSSSSISHGGTARSVKSEQEIENMQAHLIIGDDGRIDVATGGNGEAFFPLRVPSTTGAPGELEENGDSAHNEAKAAPEAPGELEAKVEDAHASEVLNFEEGQLYLVQLPRIGNLTAGKAPKGAPLTDGVKQEDAEMPDAAPPDSSDTATDPLEQSSPGLEGQLGTLRRHASGKTTLVIGGSVFDVTLGSYSVSVEDVVLLNDEGHTAYPLGNVKNRVLVTPNLDSLHI